MPNIQMLNPENLGKPIAPYSNVARVKASEFLFIAGQVGADKDGKTPADFEGQCAAVFANIGAALASQGASFANVPWDRDTTPGARSSSNSRQALEIRIAIIGPFIFPLHVLILPRSCGRPCAV